VRYYDLDITGRVKGSYAVPQPGKTLHLLEDAPDDKSKRDAVPGVKWEPDLEIISAEAVTTARLATRVKAMADLKTLIALHDADKSKVKIEDILNRLHQIEILIDAR